MLYEATHTITTNKAYDICESKPQTSKLNKSFKLGLFSTSASTE